MRWRWLAWPLLGLFGLALVWLAGFTAFERNARLALSDPPVSDGIVALTGGADRIETALRLLAGGKAPRLLVSGVGHGVDLTEVLHHARVDPSVVEAGITIGRAASDTVGNASETAAWARQNDLHTIIVVTAGYHMARALLEIGRELPDVQLRPVPVRSPALRSRDGLPTLRLLASEYDKFLAAWLGLNRWAAKGSKP
ncbi:MAG: YdcF family protein [Acetobacteraceae bacterium]|nr:YdcF family protein [Acetobacteraceae bacterium]